MRKVLITSVLALASTGSAAADVPAPSATLTNFVCHRAKAALSRTISVEAVMHAKTGLPKLEIQFELQRRSHESHRFADVIEGDLGQWISPPDSTLGQRPDDVWKLDKQVVNLAAPAAYRLEVHFRWSSDPQHTDEETLASPRCFQPR